MELKLKLKTANQFTQVQMKVPNELPINDALQIQAAEYWLELGEADLALKELEKLPTSIWRSARVLKTRIAAMGVLRERSEAQN